MVFCTLYVSYQTNIRLVALYTGEKNETRDSGGGLYRVPGRVLLLRVWLVHRNGIFHRLDDAFFGKDVFSAARGLAGSDHGALVVGVLDVVQVVDVSAGARSRQSRVLGRFGLAAVGLVASVAEILGLFDKDGGEERKRGNHVLHGRFVSLRNMGHKDVVVRIGLLTPTLNSMTPQRTSMVELPSPKEMRFS